MRRREAARAHRMRHEVEAERDEEVTDRALLNGEDE